MLPRLFAKELLNKFHGTPSQKKKKKIHGTPT